MVYIKIFDASRIKDASAWHYFHRSQFFKDVDPIREDLNVTNKRFGVTMIVWTLSKLSTHACVTMMQPSLPRHAPRSVRGLVIWGDCRGCPLALKSSIHTSMPSRLTRRVGPMLFECGANVSDVGTTFKQRLADGLSFPDTRLHVVFWKGGIQICIIASA